MDQGSTCRICGYPYVVHSIEWRDGWPHVVVVGPNGRILSWCTVLAGRLSSIEARLAALEETMANPDDTRRIAA